MSLSEAEMTLSEQKRRTNKRMFGCLQNNWFDFIIPCRSSVKSIQVEPQDVLHENTYNGSQTWGDYITNVID